MREWQTKLFGQKEKGIQTMSNEHKKKRLKLWTPATYRITVEGHRFLISYQRRSLMTGASVAALGSRSRPTTVGARITVG
jgi:hypothetical protein